MRNLLSLFFLIFSTSAAFAGQNKFGADIGYFAISAKSGNESASISNPSAFRLSYLHAVTLKTELNVSYSILMADFSGSDLGYGLDVGFNHFFLTSASDEKYKDERIEIKRYEIYRPYAGIGFHQRNFQSVKNSYAGLGAHLGVEKYYDEKMNLKLEGRYIQLAGSGESTASEMALFFGVVFKL